MSQSVKAVVFFNTFTRNESNSYRDLYVCMYINVLVNVESLCPR
jgi:hypothetical protein